MLCCLKIVTKFLVKFSKLLMSFSDFFLILLVFFLVDLNFKKLVYINNCLFQIFHLLSNDTDFVIADRFFIQLLCILSCWETFFKVMESRFIILLVLIILSNFLINDNQIGWNILNLFLKPPINCFIQSDFQILHCIMGVQNLIFTDSKTHVRFDFTDFVLMINWIL